MIGDSEIAKREKILNRTLPGRLAAKKMGKLGGRPKKLDTEKIELLKKLYDDPNHKVEDICKQLKISKPSFYSYLHSKHKK